MRIFLAFLGVIFSLTTQVYADGLFYCSSGQEIHDFRTSTNYLHPVLIDSAYLPNSANNPAMATFAVSEGPTSGSSSIRILNFTDNLGNPNGPQFTRTWSTINLGFAPTVIKLAKMRVFQSYDSRMVVIAQHPQTKALHFQLLSFSGAPVGGLFTFNPAPTFSGGRHGGLSTMVSNDSLGTLATFGRSQYMPVTPNAQINVGLQLCNEPALVLNATGSGITQVQCLSSSGAGVGSPYFQTFASWTHQDPRFQDKVEIFKDINGRLGFIFVDYLGKLRLYQPSTAISLELLPNGLNLESFLAGSNSHGNPSSQFLSYTLADGRFGEISLSPSSLGVVNETPLTWYTQMSQGLLQSTNISSNLFDADIASNTKADTVMSFRAPVAGGVTHVSGLLARQPGEGTVGAIIDLYSTQAQSPVTYGSIAGASIAQMNEDLSIIVYSRRTTQQHVGSSLQMLLFFSICDRP